MALEDLISTIYGLNLELPLKYGQQAMEAYRPLFGYMTGQAQNATNLGTALQSNAGALGQTAANQMGSVGNSAMNLYGNLANTQASMYQAELPTQLEEQKFNSLSPALAGLLSYGGMGDFNFAPLKINYNRPDVMSGYQGVVDRAYKGVKDAIDRGYQESNNAYSKAHGGMQGYDRKVYGSFGNMMDKLPSPPKKPESAAERYARTGIGPHGGRYTPVSRMSVADYNASRGWG